MKGDTLSLVLNRSEWFYPVLGMHAVACLFVSRPLLRGCVLAHENNGLSSDAAVDETSHQVLFASA